MAEVLILARTPKGALAPTDDLSRKALLELGEGECVLVTIRRPRNLGHHRKFFAMVQLAYSLWNPAEQKLDGMPAKKSFNQFRKELVIQAGFYEIVLGFDGQARLEATSLNFGAMGEERFTEVYDAVFSVLASGVLEGITKEDAERIADQVVNEGF